jgi:hypothetical protein
MRRLFVYEELVDILVEVVDVAATSDDSGIAAKFAELRGRLDEAVDVEDAVYNYHEGEPVPEGEYDSFVRSFARVIAAVDKVGRLVGRRRRSYEAAKRWRSGVDRHAEVGRVKMLRREALKRLYVGGEQPRSEVIVIDEDDENEDSSGDDDDDEEGATEDDENEDSLADEGDEEMHGVDDDPDSQLDL